MKKEEKIFKIQNYDDFKCTADKCKFTCCSGWDVNIDKDTYIKWKNNKKSYILQNVIKTINEGKEEYFVNKEIHESCPFLDKKGLCNIVKNDGEDYLSLTCHSFPRIENVFEDKKEFTLSCACPEVVEIISKLNDKIKILSNYDEEIEKTSLGVTVRELLIYIIQEQNISLDDRLMICFEILVDILNNNSIEEAEALEKYRRDVYLKRLITQIKEIDINLDEAMEELNYLFLDITENYKDVTGLENSLREIYKYAETIKDTASGDNWKKYKKSFEKYDILVENCIVSKVIGSCISDDIEEIILNFELIILEYLLMRYAVFLKYSINEKDIISIEDIKDYIVVFSRVISNNSDAVLDFLEEGFGDAILESGYIRFIMM